MGGEERRGLFISRALSVSLTDERTLKSERVFEEGEEKKGGKRSALLIPHALSGSLTGEIAR